MTEPSKRAGIHPLAIASICDHFTRVSVGGAFISKDSPVVGLLFGVQEGNKVEIMDATEGIYEVVNGEVTLDIANIEKKKVLYTAVFKRYELIGWYTTGSEATMAHMAIHRSMMTLNEAPLFLLMNDNSDSKNDQLPFSLFESELHVINNVQTQIFVDVSAQLTSSPMERVAMDQIVKVSIASDATESSVLEVQTVGFMTSLRTLVEKIDVLLAFLTAARNGDISPNPNILRRISKICDQLPTMDPNTLKESFCHDTLDCLIVTYLAMATSTTNSLMELNNKYNTAYALEKKFNFMG